MFSITWTRHKLKFFDTISRMSARLDLVRRGASVREFNDFRYDYSFKEEQLQMRLEEKVVQRRHEVYSWLRATSMENEQHRLDTIRKNYPSTGRWLLRDQRFRTWYDPQSTTSTLLWLNGVPGAGKFCLWQGPACLYVFH